MTLSQERAPVDEKVLEWARRHSEAWAGHAPEERTMSARMCDLLLTEHAARVAAEAALVEAHDQKALERDRLRKEIMRLMREYFDPTPAVLAYELPAGEWSDNAEDVADKIIAMIEWQLPLHPAVFELFRCARDLIEDLHFNVAPSKGSIWLLRRAVEGATNAQPALRGSTQADRLATLEDELEAARKETEQCHAKATCMCGSYVAEHDIGSGHAPVSMYDYSLDQAEKRAEAAEAALQEARRIVAAAREFYEKGTVLLSATVARVSE